MIIYFNSHSMFKGVGKAASAKKKNKKKMFKRLNNTLNILCIFLRYLGILWISNEFSVTIQLCTLCVKKISSLW